MAEVLVVFGSASDQGTYRPLLDRLDLLHLEYQFRLCSAHKSPEALEEILKMDYKMVIAGAGLAAHLPGVIASKLLPPVIGVPCEGPYGGLDALLSVAQMPPGIPVLAVGVNRGDYAAHVAAETLLGRDMGFYTFVNLVGSLGDAAKKAGAWLNERGVPVAATHTPQAFSVNLQFVPLGQPVSDFPGTILCPLAHATAPDAAVAFWQQSQAGLWVGLNNWKNAALAALQLLNGDGRYDSIFFQERAQMRETLQQHNQGS